MLRTIIFFSIVVGLPILNLVWWWIADNRVRRQPRARRWRIALAAFAIFQLAAFAWMFITRILGYREWEPALIMATVYIWHLIVLPLTVIAMLLGSIIRGVVGGLRWISRRLPRAPLPGASAPDVDPVDPPRGITRREMLTLSAAALPMLVTGGAVIRSAFQMREFRIRRIDVPLAQLPPELNGTRIAVVSDMHVGRFTHGRVLRDIADATNALNADLVMLPGDLIDFSLKDLDEAIDAVRRIESHQGLFLCEGNHDLFDSREGFERGVKSAGLPLLLNEAKTITIRGVPVQILGLMWGRRRADAMADRHRTSIVDNMIQLEPLRQPDTFQILLAHHPHAFDAAAEAGIPLTLSGHTHGGQLMLTPRYGVGPVMFKYWSGLYRQRDSALVVSNGVGNWFPIRTSAPAEILDVRLTKA